LIEKPPKIGQDIRPIGCDIKADGKPILTRFSELGPIELGLIASIGVNEVTIFRKPVVAVLSTGDEVRFNYSFNRFTFIKMIKNYSDNKSWGKITGWLRLGFESNHTLVVIETTIS